MRYAFECLNWCHCHLLTHRQTEIFPLSLVSYPKCKPKSKSTLELKTTTLWGLQGWWILWIGPFHYRTRAPDTVDLKKRITLIRMSCVKYIIMCRKFHSQKPSREAQTVSHVLRIPLQALWYTFQKISKSFESSIPPPCSLKIVIEEK